MLRHPEPGRHDLHELLAAVAHDLGRVERRSVTAPALLRPVLECAVRPLTELQRLPMVPDLPSGVPALRSA